MEVRKEKPVCPSPCPSNSGIAPISIDKVEKNSYAASCTTELPDTLCARSSFGS